MTNFTMKFQRNTENENVECEVGKRKFYSYNRNDAKHAYSYSNGLIGSHIRLFDCYQNHRPQIILNR